MEITREVFDKINELDEAFSPIETLSRVLKLYDNLDNEIEYMDKVVLIYLLSEKILEMKYCLNNFTTFLMQ